MAQADDKRRLIMLARRGPLEGEHGFRAKLYELNKAGITGPGADYGLDWNERPFHRTALWEATWKNHETIVKLLLEKGATVDLPDYQGRSPLHEAAYYGYKNLVEAFLDRGHPIDALDNFQQTPIFRAVEAGRDEIVEILVQRKASLNKLDNDNVTVQHIAAFEGHQNMAHWLYYKGAFMNRFSSQDREKQEGQQPAQPAAAQPRGVVTDPVSPERPTEAEAPNAEAADSVKDPDAQQKATRSAAAKTRDASGTAAGGEVYR